MRYTQLKVVLLRTLLYIALIIFSGFCCVVLKDDVFNQKSEALDWLSHVDLQFRINAYLGADDGMLEKRFGQAMESEIVAHPKECDFAWWPSPRKEDNPWLKIHPGQMARFRYFADGDLVVYVCQVADSNGIWRVIGDVTPPKNIVF